MPKKRATIIDGAIHERRRTLEIINKYRKQGSEDAEAIYRELIVLGVGEVCKAGEKQRY